MIWYQYIFLVIAVALYSATQLHTFGKAIWQKKASGFFGMHSDLRKYKNFKKEQGHAYFGSTTFLVWTTDFYHFAQMLMKICFSIGITGLTWWAVLAFTLWTGIQWGVFKLFSK